MQARVSTQRCTRGIVEQGRQLGRTLGFPTANIRPPADGDAPATGVYAAVVVTPGGDTWPAAVNVGRRPTVERDGALLIEAHLIGFDGDLYGSVLEVVFQCRLRDEQRFDSLAALRGQLDADKSAALAALATRPSTAMGAATTL